MSRSMEYSMKNIIGVAFLAILPVACGSVVPTAPDMPASGNTPQASAAVRASSDRNQPVCPMDPRVVGLDLKVIRRAEHEVTVRVEPLLMGGNDQAPACVVPTWSVKPLGRGVGIAAGADRQEATLRAVAGSYVITAFVENGSKAGLFASLDVSMR
jgi:hypothetical protein